jgi:hypothetical protein
MAEQVVLFSVLGMQSELLLVIEGLVTKKTTLQKIT